MVRLAICTPSTGLCRMDYTHALVRLVMYAATVRFQADDPAQELRFLPIEGSGISANRERLVADVLATDATHILFLDEDMTFPPDAAHQLLARQVPIVGCNYPMRMAPPRFTALALTQDTRVATRADSTGLEPAAYIGFGCTLIAREVFEVVPRPWFLIGYNLTTHAYTTEDHAFCRKAREAGFPVYVDHDVSKRVLHIGAHRYSWAEVPSGETHGE